MSFLSNLLGGANRYKDALLASEATAALATDPLLADPSAIVVTSQKGVMTLTGKVHRAQEKDRIEGVVRSALTSKGLKHERIINELKVG